MKKYLLFCLTLLLAILIRPTVSYGTHAAGADLTYENIGPNTFRVTMKFYRDCSGTVAPNLVVLTYESATCGNTGNLNLYPIGPGVDLPPAECVLGQTTCNGGNILGVEEWVYEGTLVLPNNCTDWILSTSIGNRNNSVNNLIDPGYQNLYSYALLNNDTAPANNSPTFTNKPITQFCVGRQFYYDQGADDIDGDSLVFSLVSAQGAWGAPLAYAPGYSPTSPILTVDGVTIDPQTGLISFIPTTISIIVICVLVEEYRNGTLIGSVKRDMEVEIRNDCIVDTPTYDPLTLPGFTAACGDTTITLKFDNDVQCGSLISDGTDFRILGPDGFPVSVKSAKSNNCLGGLTKEISLELLSPLCINGTYYIWSKLGNDANTLLSKCGSPMVEFDSIAFTVNDCYEGDKIDLLNVTVTNNDSIGIMWSIPSGLPVGQFEDYQIFRSLSPGGYYGYVGSTFATTDTVFYDTTANVQTTSYYYNINMTLRNCLINSPSDSIGNILLTEIPQSDTNKINLSWTSYWGWMNPMYYIMESKVVENNWTETAATTANTYLYSKPLASGSYKVKVETRLSGSPMLVSESNWIIFDTYINEVIVPNVFTPNDDDQNESFKILNIEQHPNSKLRIYNRWGKKVYENDNYMNDWNGEKFSEGVYFYILNVSNGSTKYGTVSILRGEI